ncbi:MAG TPA: DUF6263 family protein [Gemmatales bacterium]|nr:DUF6263 family protein [Gemmatales bacterium]HMP57783.1 DUF6263 family protein [Gemmatales bacterium]
MRIGLALSLVWGACTLPAQAQEVELAWKFAQGDPTFYQKLKTSTTQTMKVMGQTIIQNLDQEFIFSWTVKSVDADKVVLEQKIEAAAMKINLAGNEVRFDTQAKEAADNPLSSYFRPLIGSVFTITLDANKMTVLSVGGREDFIKKMKEANPQMEPLLRVILTDEQLRQMCEPAFTSVPDRGTKVNVNDTWSRTSTLSMGPIGTFDTKYDYKYLGTEKRTIDGKEVTLHKIEMKTSLTYKAPEEKDRGGLNFRIESGKLDTSEATGTILFNAEIGRVFETKMDVKLKGKLDISVTDVKSEVELEQTQKTETTFTDKSPIEAPK